MLRGEQRRLEEDCEPSSFENMRAKVLSLSWSAKAKCKPADEKRLPVVLGVTETACAVREHNEQLLQDLTSACEGYPELVVILNIFDSEDDSLPRSLNCGASEPPIDVVIVAPTPAAVAASTAAASQIVIADDTADTGSNACSSSELSPQPPPLTASPPS